MKDSSMFGFKSREASTLFEFGSRGCSTIIINIKIKLKKKKLIIFKHQQNAIKIEESVCSLVQLLRSKLGSGRTSCKKEVHVL